MTDDHDYRIVVDTRPDNERANVSHVIDRDNNVWAVVRDGGMATRAHYAGIVSIGIARLAEEAGPLIPLNPAQHREQWIQDWGQPS